MPTNTRPAAPICRGLSRSCSTRCAHTMVTAGLNKTNLKLKRATT